MLRDTQVGDFYFFAAYRANFPNGATLADLLFRFEFINMTLVVYHASIEKNTRKELNINKRLFLNLGPHRASTTLVVAKVVF